MTKQEAIARIIDHMIVHEMNEPRAIHISEALNMAIKALKQKSEIGHWIRFKDIKHGNYYHIKCSECEQYWSIDGHAKIFKYCFNCGAKMVELQGSEDME